MENLHLCYEGPNELHEHYKFTVEKGQDPLRIDKYLMNFVENATRNKIQLAAKSGHIFVNGSVVKSNYKVKPNDNIRILFNEPPKKNILKGEDIPLDIVFEDNHILVINKILILSLGLTL